MEGGLHTKAPKFNTSSGSNCRAIAAELNTGSFGSCILGYASPNRVTNLFLFLIFGSMVYSVEVIGSSVL